MRVVESEDGPSKIFLKQTPAPVESVEDTWRLDDEWWRERPISRRYFECVLEEGQRLTVFKDLFTGRWYRQAG